MTNKLSHPISIILKLRFRKRKSCQQWKSWYNFLSANLYNKKKFFKIARLTVIFVIFFVIITPFGTWYPAITASDCKLRPLPKITGFILKAQFIYRTKYLPVPRHWKSFCPPQKNNVTPQGGNISYCRRVYSRI